MTMTKQVLFERDELARAVVRISHEIIERCEEPAAVMLVGIRSRGVYLARRIAGKIAEFISVAPPVASLDVTAYRDDRSTPRQPPSGERLTTMPVLDDRTVVLVDDVIFRGRTIRAALDALAQYGQPKKILVAVLVDRGARELPIRADIVGKNVAAGDGYRVNVLLEEVDGVDQITVAPWQGSSQPDNQENR
jgi:pyrimidine operon attenuation protein/uracil phosphoribosyltransferase